MDNKKLKWSTTTTITATTKQQYHYFSIYARVLPAPPRPWRVDTGTSTGVRKQGVLLGAPARGGIPRVLHRHAAHHTGLTERPNLPRPALESEYGAAW